MATIRGFQALKSNLLKLHQQRHFSVYSKVVNNSGDAELKSKSVGFTAKADAAVVKDPNATRLEAKQKIVSIMRRKSKLNERIDSINIQLKKMEAYKKDSNEADLKFRHLCDQRQVLIARREACVRESSYWYAIRGYANEVHFAKIEAQHEQRVRRDVKTFALMVVLSVLGWILPKDDAVSGWILLKNDHESSPSDEEQVQQI